MTAEFDLRKKEHLKKEHGGAVLDFAVHKSKKDLTAAQSAHKKKQKEDARQFELDQAAAAALHSRRRAEADDLPVQHRAVDDLFRKIFEDATNGLNLRVNGLMDAIYKILKQLVAQGTMSQAAASSLATSLASNANNSQVRAQAQALANALSAPSSAAPVVQSTQSTASAPPQPLPSAPPEEDVADASRTLQDALGLVYRKAFQYRDKIKNPTPEEREELLAFAVMWKSLTEATRTHTHKDEDVIEFCHRFAHYLDNKYGLTASQEDKQVATSGVAPTLQVQPTPTADKDKGSALTSQLYRFGVFMWSLGAAPVNSLTHAASSVSQSVFSRLGFGTAPTPTPQSKTEPKPQTKPVEQKQKDPGHGLTGRLSDVARHMWTLAPSLGGFSNAAGGLARVPGTVLSALGLRSAPVIAGSREDEDEKLRNGKAPQAGARGGKT